MKWINEQSALDAAIEHVAQAPVVAVDTEADSLHSYFDKVCLVQISVADEDLVVDPLAKVDLSRFGTILGNPDVLKVFHGGDYDLRIMNRDFGWTVRNLFDTSVAAQLLGYEAFGLAALLERHFGVKVNKAHQRADWAMRPLPADMLAYATMDTHYLIALANKLRDELHALNRWTWAVEEFARMENIRYREASEDDLEPWRKMKNIGNLDRRSLGIVRELYAWRDALARKADRPPFKIMGNEAIIDISKERPATVADLAKLKSVSKYHLDRYGRDLAASVRRVLELPEESLPDRNEPRPWTRDRDVEARVNRMKKIRDRVATELKVDPAILAPRHVLTAIATGGTLDVPAMREWQKSVLGEQLLGALN
ncbi:MAG TPA: ribonuclease D [Thermoanaerobaculia bacterium]|jgi:ribonuclease D